MGVLEQVTQLKNQGMSDEEIVSNLQQQGISPKQITDAINQAQIKNAVASENPPPTPQETSPIAEAGASQTPYTPQTQEVGQEYQQGAYPAEQPAGEYYAEQPVQTPAIDSDTVIEISNQVFSEKIKQIKKSIDDFNEFKTIFQTKVNGIDERLKRIEKIIDTIQIKVLEKVGAYGQELNSTKKEIAMMQDSFKKITGKKSSISKKKKTSKKKK
ncbi:hypothetical protein DRN73_02360 [Candidatus Pacearchaeota archaeon]|nr:MAG: hypothetical protein DRN73_02360 [Candidatus Pacearchaeota archaeon]